MSFFFISLKITLAVVDIEIKHLSIYWNRLEQATFIYVNTPSPAPGPGLSAQLRNAAGRRNPLRLLCTCFFTQGGRKASPGVAPGSARGLRTMDRARRAQCAEVFPVPCGPARTELPT